MIFNIFLIVFFRFLVISTSQGQSLNYQLIGIICFFVFCCAYFWITVKRGCKEQVSLSTHTGLISFPRAHAAYFLSS